MKEIGVQHVGVADTIGVGTPLKVRAAMLAALEHYPLAEVSGHFHDTYGQALSNILECLQLGVHTFDASVSGLGGCPYAKGATGNVATEDVVYLLHGLGIETGIDLDKLVDAGDYIRKAIGKANGSRVARAILAKRGVAIEVGQIAKSVIFRRKADEVAVLVVASGDRRVDEKKVASIVGPIGRADADFVKAKTGFSIGGVSPIGHATPVVTLIDRDLFRFAEIWAAAGHPNGVFPMTPAELERLTGAPVHDISQAHAP